jgi:hypothetical protein
LKLNLNCEAKDYLPTDSSKDVILRARVCLRNSSYIHDSRQAHSTASGVASPTIQSRYANIAMFINYQPNQFLKK